MLKVNPHLHPPVKTWVLLDKTGLFGKGKRVRTNIEQKQGFKWATECWYRCFNASTPYCVGLGMTRSKVTRAASVRSVAGHFSLAFAVAGTLILFGTRSPIGAFFAALALGGWLYVSSFKLKRRSSSSEAFHRAALSALIKSLPQASWVVNSDGQVISENNRYVELPSLVKSMYEASTRDAHRTQQWNIGKISNGEVSLYVTGIPILSHDNNLQGYVFLGSDQVVNTDEDETRLAARALEVCADGVVITRDDGVIISTNCAFQEMTGFSRVETVGIPLSKLCNETSNSTVMDAIERAQLGHHIEADLIGIRKDSTSYPMRAAFDAIVDATGEKTNVVAVISDISEKVRRENQILALVNYDHLTGLLNRKSFDRWADQTVLECQRKRCQFAILFVDIDRFKIINDTAGHLAGDAVIKAVAQRLQDIKPHDCIAARMSGDEFLLGIPKNRDRDFKAEALKVLNTCSQLIDVNGTGFSVTASIGMAVYPDDGRSLQELVTHADMAMIVAKSQGGGKVQTFTPEIRKRLQYENELSVQLKGAEDSEFVVHYQPKVILGTGEICGFEALVRWVHPFYGEISPASFIKQAEENGTIRRIGARVLSEVCKQIRQWGADAKPVAINVSVSQLRHPDFVPNFLTIMGQHKVPRHLIDIEITESVLISDDNDVCKKISTLRAAGIRVAIDDFGTGYSSLSYLTRLSFDFLKIDRSFVSKLEESRKTRKVFEFLVNLSKELDVTLIAEGVETQSQVDLLNGFGCSVGQGYFFGKPMPAEDATTLLLNNMESAERIYA